MENTKAIFPFFKGCSILAIFKEKLQTTLFRIPTETSQMFGQRFIIFEKLKYRSQLLLKLQAIEIATSFHWISSRST